MRTNQTKKFKKLLYFVRFTHLFQRVERMVFVNGTKRYENDAEHSYQLALVGWYLIEQEKLKLNQEKVIIFALVHDLVEAYAGDTYFYSNQETLNQKAIKEHQAILELQANFPEFSSLHQAIKEYESRETKESKFIYALDKLLPVINIYLDKGLTWQLKGVTLEQLVSSKTTKIALSPEIVPYFRELVSILEQNRQLFVPKG